MQYFNVKIICLHFFCSTKCMAMSIFLHFLLKANSFLHWLNDISHVTKRLFFKLQHDNPTKE